MKPLIITLVATSLLLMGCTSETEYCRAYCQRAGECIQCPEAADIDGCIDECKSLSTDQQKKLVDCYKGECENIFICKEILGDTPPSPCN